MHALTSAVLVAVVLISQGGCAVAMALGGHADPDFSMMTEGASRVAVEQEFGSASDERPYNDGMACTYDYATGNEPDVLRVLAHGAFDALTFGCWELAGIGIESAVDRKENSLMVVYDADARVVSARKRIGEGPDDRIVTLVAASERIGEVPDERMVTLVPAREPNR